MARAELAYGKQPDSLPGLATSFLRNYRPVTYFPPLPWYCYL